VKKRARNGEQGQVIILLVLSMVVLIGMTALVIDVGIGWYARRQLQATVDAAALAGAQDLPSPAIASATANAYLGKNPVRAISSIQTSVITKCLSTAPGCNPANAVVVTATAKANTFFARVFGINSWTVTAKATACQPCGGKKLDVMILLDRTGSMNQGGSPNKITNAKAGIMTMLDFFDPGTVRAGLAVLAPADSVATRCQAPNAAAYDKTTSAYVVVPLANDFKVNGVIDPTSNLVSTVNCIKAAGSTSYALALEAAQAELATNGRPDAMHVIVFLTDGAANTGPGFYPANSPYNTEPCGSGVTSAAAAKAAGTRIYTIGYAIGGDVCRSDAGAPETPSITPDQALSQIATTPSDYYIKPDTGTLDAIFAAIAADINQGASRLVDNGWG
jgi:Flp pilus assembly protein TadG